MSKVIGIDLGTTNSCVAIMMVHKLKFWKIEGTEQLSLLLPLQMKMKN